MDIWAAHLGDMFSMGKPLPLGRGSVAFARSSSGWACEWRLGVWVAFALLRYGKQLPYGRGSVTFVRSSSVCAFE